MERRRISCACGPPTAQNGRSSLPVAAMLHSSLISLRSIDATVRTSTRVSAGSVQEWFDRWWPTVDTLRPRTRVRDETSFRTHIAPTFGSMPLARVDRTTLREWVAKLSDPDGADLAPATVTKAVQFFNKTMRAAVDDRPIASYPVERLPFRRSFARRCASSPTMSWTIAARYRPFVCWPGTAACASASRWVSAGNASISFAVRRSLPRRWSIWPGRSPSVLRNEGRASNPRIPSFRGRRDGDDSRRSCRADQLVFQSPDGHAIRLGLVRRRFWTPALTAAGFTPLRIHDLATLRSRRRSSQVPTRSRSRCGWATRASPSSSTGMATSIPSSKPISCRRSSDHVSVRSSDVGGQVSTFLGCPVRFRT